MATCNYCGKEIVNPFKCNYCGENFCSEHRLPPNHKCPGLDSWKSRSGPAIGSHKKKKSWISKKKESIFQNISLPFASQEAENEEKRKDHGQNSTKPISKKSKYWDFLKGLIRFEGKLLKLLKYVGGILFVLGCLITWVPYLGLENISKLLPSQFVKAVSYFIPSSILSPVSNWTVEFFSSPISAWENGAWISVIGFILFFSAWVVSKVRSKYGRRYRDRTAFSIATKMGPVFIFTIIFWMLSLMVLKTDSATMVLENTWPRTWFMIFLIILSSMGLYMRRIRNGSWWSKRRGVGIPKIGIPKSLKIFFIIFLIFVVEYLFLDKLYSSYSINHLLAIIGAMCLSWTIFKKISSIRLHNNARLFGAFLLSIILVVGGFITELFVFSMSFPFMVYLTSLYGLYQNIYRLGPSVYLTIETFLVALGLGLIILGGYLNFRFMRKAGIIIFPR